MTTGLLPVVKARFFDNDGTPLNGGLVYTYQAGTTAPLATYTDSTGMTANTNPVVLDAYGYANIWLNGTYKIVIKTSANVQLTSTDNVISLNAIGAYYIDTGGANAYIISPSPPLAAYTPGTIYQIKISTGNTGPSTLNVSGLGVKNITFANLAPLTSGAMPTGSIVQVVYDGSEWQLLGVVPSTSTSGTFLTLSSYLNEAKGTDIASATSTPIGAANGNFVHITGTTTITSFDTIQAGTRRVLKFDGILTLTHNSTTLILPGGANIITAAGDAAQFISEGSGNWRCVSYIKANGQALSITGTEGTLASATTTDLGTSLVNLVSISGTTTITSFGSTATTLNPVYFIRFTGALILTYNATSLILPTAANITTVAGDSAIVKYEGSGNWRCTSYSRADGSPVIASGTSGNVLTSNGTTWTSAPLSAGAMILLSTQTASNSASLAFTSVITSSYDYYIFEIQDIRCAAGGTDFDFLMSANNGSTYQSSYLSTINTLTTGSSSAFTFTTGQVGYIQLTTNVNTGAADAIAGKVELFSPNGTVRPKSVRSYLTHDSGATAAESRGINQVNTAVNAVKFQFGTGNITSGKIYCYGVKNT